MSRVSIWLAAMTIGILTWGLSVSALAEPESSKNCAVLKATCR